MPSSPPIWAQHPPMEAEHDFAVHGIPSPYESYQRAPPPPTPPSRPMEQRFLEPPMPPWRSYGALKTTVVSSELSL
ncbi:hypothetical protein DIPPA_33821 [Diplonema papillatum]|nr:hypothetical protein DIPPA_33821 [Diplonema papillatum]